MARWNRFAFLVLCLSTVVVLSSCDSLVPCQNYFGNRLLEGETSPPDGQPTQLVTACMYGADTVGPLILHQSTYQLECGKKYNLDGIEKDSPDVMRQVPNTIALADACGVGARGFVRTVLRMDDTAADLKGCQDYRGKNGINPELPCD